MPALADVARVAADEEEPYVLGPGQKRTRPLRHLEASPLTGVQREASMPNLHGSQKRAPGLRKLAASPKPLRRGDADYAGETQDT
ncbi:hypothetical protein CB1_125142007 [Camelus ferus]|nr:hypothetical protein CB1_125142007 [Camelus ferus]